MFSFSFSLSLYIYQPPRKPSPLCCAMDATDHPSNVDSSPQSTHALIIRSLLTQGVEPVSDNWKKKADYFCHPGVSDARLHKIMTPSACRAICAADPQVPMSLFCFGVRFCSVISPFRTRIPAFHFHIYDGIPASACAQQSAVFSQLHATPVRASAYPTLSPTRTFLTRGASPPSATVPTPRATAQAAITGTPSSNRRTARHPST